MQRGSRRRAAACAVSAVASPEGVAMALFRSLLCAVVLSVLCCPPALCREASPLEAALDAELRGDSARALELFDQAVEQEGLAGKQLAAALAGRADFYGARSQWPEALADYDRAIALTPKDASLWYRRGNAKKESGDPSGALADYGKALELDPGLESAYLMRALVRERLGDSQGAAQDFTRSAEQAARPRYSPGSGPQVSSSWEVNDEFRETMAVYNQAVRDNPSDPMAYVERGVALSSHGRHEQALADFGKALSLNPSLAGAYYNRGFTYEKMGQMEKARADWARAKEINPSIEVPDL